MRSRSLEAALRGLADRGVSARSVDGAVRERVEPVDLARAGQLHEGDHLFVAGLEADRGAGWDVEPHPPGLPALEAERAIDLEEVEVGANLNGPVTRIRHGQLDGAASNVGLDGTVAQQVLSWNHRFAVLSD